MTCLKNKILAASLRLNTGLEVCIRIFEPAAGYYGWLNHARFSMVLDNEAAIQAQEALFRDSRVVSFFMYESPKGGQNSFLLVSRAEGLKRPHSGTKFVENKPEMPFKPKARKKTYFYTNKSFKYVLKNIDKSPIHLFKKLIRLL